MKEIVSWVIRVEWADGTREDIADMPDDVAGTVDKFLGTVEQERW